MELEFILAGLVTFSLTLYLIYTLIYPEKF